jgi:hypothetical protein
VRKDWKRLTICLSPEEYHRLRLAAASNEISMSEVMRVILKGYLKQCDLELKSVSSAKQV